jgi:lipopolysaccharide export system protein LptA
MRRVLIALSLVWLGLPTYVAGQAGSCHLVSSQMLERRTTVTGAQTIFVVAPVVQCTGGGGARISANNGTIHQITNEVYLSGNVSFRDPERRLNSDQATYSSMSGRLYAVGNVVFTDIPEGMTLRGPELEYYRAMEGRPQSQAIATQRPHLTLQPRARPGAERATDAEPIEIDADRMTMFGNEQYTAVGRVEIRRTDFQAFSNEARVDQLNDQMELRGNARVHGEEFDLAAEMIDMALPDDQLERVVARQNAELSGDDLRIDGSDIRLFFADDLLQRVVARQDASSPVRPVATARGFRLEADSLDALAPAQRLDRVIAIGEARGESLDTTLIPTGRIAQMAPAGNLTAADRDWILGDTVIGYFVANDTLALPPEPAEAGENRREEVQLERVLARGSARSLYRVVNNRDGRNQRPGLNYLVGEIIELSFLGGELSVADVRGLQRGLFLDPADAAAVAPEEPPPAAEPALDEPPVQSQGR